MTIKYVEFDITASGFGCVNTNGGVNPKTGREGSDDGFKNRIFSKQRNGKMYISSNCIRGHFFEPDARGMMLADKAGFNNNDGQRGELVIGKKEMPQISQQIASSYLGLVRGYMLTEKGGDSIKRNSPLMVTDWINEMGEPNANEVMVNHLAVDEKGKKESNSLFYQDTWGNTYYKGQAVLSVENLQFLAMDNRLGHQSVRFSQKAKKASIADEIEQFRDALINNLKVIALKNGMTKQVSECINVEHGLFIKPNALFAYPEEGILLNNEAIHALVLESKSRLANFSIIKSKGFVKVSNITENLTTAFGCEGLDMVISSDEIPEYTSFYSPYEKKVLEA